MNMKCPYCGKHAQLVTGEKIYPHRHDLHKKIFGYVNRVWCDIVIIVDATYDVRYSRVKSRDKRLEEEFQLLDSMQYSTKTKLDIVKNPIVFCNSDNDRLNESESIKAFLTELENTRVIRLK